MKIVSFDVAGLGGHGGASRVKLNPDVNIFWGLNGSGKTSLLKILHGALSDTTADLARLLVESATVTINSDLYDVDITRELKRIQRKKSRSSGSLAERRELTRRRDRLVQMMESDQVTEAEQYSLFQEYRALDRELTQAHMIWETSNQEVEGRRFTHRYLPTSRVIPASSRPTSTSARRDEPSEAEYDKAFASAIQNIWDVYQRRELNEIRGIQERGLAAIFNSVIDRQRESPVTTTDIDANQAYQSVARFFATQRINMGMSQSQFAQSYDRDNVLRGVVGEILEVEKQVADAQAPARRIEEAISDLFIGNKSIELVDGVSVNSRDGSIPLELLSSGEKQLIYILLETIAAGINCIIIDEPELSMHVDWQRRLIGIMRVINPDVQIIVATHSPEIMAGAEERCIFEL